MSDDVVVRLKEAADLMIEFGPVGKTLSGKVRQGVTEIETLRTQLTAALESNRALVEIQTELRERASAAKAEHARSHAHLTDLGVAEYDTNGDAADLDVRIPWFAHSIRAQLFAAKEREAEHQKTFERHAEIIGKQDRQIVKAEAQCAAMAEAAMPIAKIAEGKVTTSDSQERFTLVQVRDVLALRDALTQLPARSVAMGKCPAVLRDLVADFVSPVDDGEYEEGEIPALDEARKLLALLLPLPQKGICAIANPTPPVDPK
jgi:hypothetical protein